MVGAAVFAVAFAFYALLAAPTLGWLDAPEFTAAAACLGIPHSPGHPLAPQLAFLGTLVPIGDIALRVALVSAAAGAASVWLVYRTVLELCGIRELDGRRATAIAVATAAGFGLSPALVAQATRAEVYALALALSLAVVVATLRFASGHRRAVVWGALVAGLAFATHHVIAAAVIAPAFGVACIRLVRRQAPLRLIAPTMATFGCGLAVLLYLPARATAYPVVNWGAPSTLDRFLWVITGKAFHKTAALAPVSSPGEELAEIAFAVVSGAGLVTVLAVVGLYLAARLRPWRLVGGVAVVMIALSCGARWLLGFDPETPDHHAYLLPAMAGVCLLGAIAAVELARLSRWGLTAGLALLLGGAALNSRSIPDVQLEHAVTADILARAEVDSVPPRAVAITSYFQTAFRTWAMQAVENARPDVAWLDRSFLTYPGFPESARHRYPDLVPLIDAPLSANAPTPMHELVEGVGRTRPVAVELHLNLDDVGRAGLHPNGRWLQFRGDDGANHAYVQLLMRLYRLAVPGERAEVEGTILWEALVHVDLACQKGDPDALEWFDLATMIAPQDRTLAELRSRCRL